MAMCVFCWLRKLLRVGSILMMSRRLLFTISLVPSNSNFGFHSQLIFDFRYVHRIGRTARYDQSGSAYTFFTQYDADNAADLVKVLQEAGQKVPAELAALAKSSRY
jgi:hypothetical protein